MTSEEDFRQPSGLPVDLAKILADHEEWFRSGGSRGIRAELVGWDLGSANLSGKNLTRATLASSSLLKANLSGAILSGANLSGANLSGANLSGAFLDRADLTGAMLTFADLSPTFLNGANLTGADLSYANMDDVEVDSATKVSASTGTGGCRIQRYTVEMLVGLSKPQKMVMRIDDPVAEMRSHFSGFWRFIHVIALLLFVLPYIGFLLKMSLKARFLEVNGESSSTLLYALGQFIYTGGRLNHEIAWGPFLIFWFSLAYNILRLVLLFKTVSLERHETIRQLPAKFSLRGAWGRALKVLTVMFILNVILVLYHTWHFLQMRVDTSDLTRSWAALFGS